MLSWDVAEEGAGNGSEVYGARMSDWYTGRYVERRMCMQAGTHLVSCLYVSSYSLTRTNVKGMVDET